VAAFPQRRPLAYFGHGHWFFLAVVFILAVASNLAIAFFWLLYTVPNISTADGYLIRPVRIFRPVYFPNGDRFLQRQLFASVAVWPV
jgi:hypothetical protein